MDSTATLGLNDLKAILLRRKWALLLPLAAIFWVAMALALVLPSIYRSQATILIEEQEIPASIVQTTVTSFAEQRLQSIYQRIISTSRLLEIVNNLQLFPELRGQVTPDEIAAKMRENISLEFIQADVVDPKTGRAASANIAFTISYQGTDPAQTQKVASVLTSLFLEDNLKERERTAASATDFLLDEVNRLKQSMAEADARIAAFKEENVNELPELLQVNMQSLQNAEANRDRLFEQMRSLKEREGYLESQLASIPRQAMQKSRLEELQMQLANLQTRYSDQYPDVIAVKAEIGRLMAEKGAAAGNSPDNPAYVTLASQLASTKAEIASLGKQLETNDQQVVKYRALIEATPRVEEKYRMLLNDRDNLLHKHNELMQKHMEAKVSQGMEKEQKGARFTVVEPALLPDKPAKPNRLAIALIGIVLGLGAGVGMAALLEFNDGTIRTADELGKATSFPVLGVIPEIINAREARRARMLSALQVVAVGLNLVLACGAIVALRFISKIQQML